jgi:hypothetical protein
MPSGRSARYRCCEAGSAALYCGKELADWCTQHGGWELKIVEREPGTPDFRVQPRRSAKPGGLLSE